MGNAVKNLIAHFDLDSFFVSVECIKDPSLKNKPVIVGGSRERGVVAACSYAVRKFGVQSAMPIKTALRLCPHAIIVKGNYELYGKYSKIVTEIISSKAPLFEKASIDEFYLDLSGMEKFFDVLQWTIDLRNLIIAKTGLPISFGIGANKMVAKMATNESKPNGYLYVPFGYEKQFLSPLPVEKIPGVGEQTNSILKHHGFIRIGDIQLSSSEKMEQLLGKWGIDLFNKCMGLHYSKVLLYHESKSISTENTYDENITDMKITMKEIVRMTEKICFELRNEGKVAGCISIKIRYPDFETITRQCTVPFTSSDDQLIPVVKDLFAKLYKKDKGIRLLGVKLSSLSSNAVQANVFESMERKTDLYKAIDSVKKRFGKTSLIRAAGN